MATYSGVVEEGEGAATRLGFPTINIPLHDASVSGVYAARVTIDNARYDAVVFANPKRKVLEAHLLEVSDNLYGKTVSIELYEKSRESEHFKDEHALSQAIAKDVEWARAYFVKHPDK